MDWLLDSPVAQLHRFYFLAFYAGVIAVTAIACYWLTRRYDPTARLPAPPVPTAPDPYEIAYLRGGLNEVARAVVFNLLRAGQLMTSTSGSARVLQRTDKAAKAHPANLPPLEQTTFDWFTYARFPKEMFAANGLAGELQPHCAPYEDKLQREQLLRTPALSARAARVRWLGVCGVAGLGLYKLLVALAQGRSNVGFLIILGMLGAVLVWGVARPSRLTARGRKYLANLQLAFDRLKDSLPRQYSTNSFAAPVSNAAATANAPYLLAMGIFGVAALEGTAYADYHASFQRASHTSATWSGDGGSGCGSSSSCSSSSSSSSCSSSSSSCSSGSSCGGGGCGGGGCGG